MCMFLFHISFLIEEIIQVSHFCIRALWLQSFTLFPDVAPTDLNFSQNEAESRNAEGEDVESWLAGLAGSWHASG